MLSLKANIRAIITPSVEEAFINWLYDNSEAMSEANTERLILHLEREQWDPELELEFSRFVAERAGFEQIGVSSHFMPAHVRDFVEWR